MDRRVDTPRVMSRKDGGAIRYGWNHNNNNRVRPAFMEPMPPREGRMAAVVEEEAAMRCMNRRRRELLGSDISFSDCMFMMITVCGLLMLFLFAVSPWGVPPPRRL